MPAPTAVGAVHHCTGFAPVGVTAVWPVGGPVAARAAPRHAGTGAASASPVHASMAARTSAARQEGSRILTDEGIGLHRVHLDKITLPVDSVAASASDTRASRGDGGGRRRVARRT